MVNFNNGLDTPNPFSTTTAGNLSATGQEEQLSLPGTEQQHRYGTCGYCGVHNKQIDNETEKYGNVCDPCYGFLVATGQVAQKNG